MATFDLAARKPRQAPANLPALVGFGILAAIGIAAWILQLTQGLDLIAAGQSIPWGLYIAAFFLLAGTGSGLLFLAASGDLEIFPALKADRASLLTGALASFIAASYMILMDIGRPERVFNMLFLPNFKSMFVWDFYCLALSVILALLYLYLGPSKAVAGIAALLAAGVVLVEGWIPALSAGTPFWHSALIPVTFALEGLIAALSVVLLARSQTPQALLKLLATLLPVVLVLSLVEAVTGINGGNPDVVSSQGLLLGGSLAPFFWGQLALGIGLPFLLLILAASSRIAVGLAAALAFVGVFVAKLDLLLAGQAFPFMAPPATYTPTPVEIAGLIGGLGMAAFLFALGRLVIATKTEP